MLTENILFIISILVFYGLTCRINYINVFCSLKNFVWNVNISLIINIGLNLLFFIFLYMTICLLFYLYLNLIIKN